MDNPTNWPPETGSEWHTHFIYCPYCNHRQQGVGCKRNDCVPAVTAIREYEGMDRVRCIQCGKRFWFTDGREPENYPDRLQKKNSQVFGCITEFVEDYDYVCTFCNRTLLAGGKIHYNDGEVGAGFCREYWDTLHQTGQIMVICMCGARQLIRVPSGVARVVRKDGAEERWGK